MLYIHVFMKRIKIIINTTGVTLIAIIEYVTVCYMLYVCGNHYRVIISSGAFGSQLCKLCYI